MRLRAIDGLDHEAFSAFSENSIERIVCSGGGAKGVVYPGTYKALEDTGILKNVKHFAGASAGAINAALMAVGMPTALARQHLLSTNLQSLIGKSTGHLLARNTPGVSFVTRDGKPLEAFIRLHIVNAVQSFLETIPNDVEALIVEHDDFKALFNKMHGNNPIFTFHDLSILSRLFPAHFKKLTVTAVRFPNCQIQVFNSELTPDVEIALACRASASIPVILKPVEIEINGEKHQYIDGGFYDNLPTDYFDMNSEHTFEKNIKPTKTLVFAFSNGLNNNKNTIFQALYGVRWDEAITDITLENIVDNAIEIYRQLNTSEKIMTTAYKQAQMLLRALHMEIAKQVKAQILRAEESNAILVAISNIFDRLLSPLQQDPGFWHDTRNPLIQEHRLKSLTNLIKQEMKPILYLLHAGMMEKLKRRVIVKTLGGLTAPYDNIEMKEKGFHKLRSEYPLRTVELRVGTIGTGDFSQATKVARVMDALGYLDTINHVTNHELHDPTLFDSEQFYIDLMDNFECIYRAVLAGSGSDIRRNTLALEICSLRDRYEGLGKSKAVISRQVYQLVKDKVEHHLDSAAAFALTHAVEFRNHILSADELFKETYEESFKRSRFFSISNISGACLFKNTSVHEALRDKSMFALYKQKSPSQTKTRTDAIFDSLKNIRTFQDSYSEESQGLSVNSFYA